MPRWRVLVVDDEVGMLEVCADTLSQLPDVEIVVEQESARAARRLETDDFDLLITDVRMPDVDGVELLRVARRYQANIPVLVLTAFPTVDSAVETLKLGAADYVVKPFKPEQLLSMSRRLLEEGRLRAEINVLGRHVSRTYVFDQIIGKSGPMQRVFEIIQRVAPTDADVLILGETGTGKELVAHSIHARSKRSGGRFVPVDCGAIPDNLMESELFGHERGAFTGADARSPGLLELADKGTFFLDEVAELPLRLQAKLLRVLQERRVRRVGGKDEIPIDVRIIAATSRDLDVEMRGKRFREDLYYRIHVARVELPALRDRRDDIPLLAERFLSRYGAGMGKPDAEFDAECLEVLQRYPWPGNVRELQNAIRRILALARSIQLSVDDLPDDIVVRSMERGDSGGGAFFELRAQRMASFEREYFSDVLHRHGGDVTAGAAEAGLPRGTFYRLLKKHDLVPSEFRD